MKKEKIYIALIICLSIISISLIGYIIYNHKSEKDDNKTPNTPNEVIPGNNDNDENDNNKETINIELKNNGVKEIESDIEKVESVTYKVKINNSLLEIYYNKGYTYFDINGELSSVYTGDNSALYKLEKYNDYVFVTLNCQCGIPASEYVIDLDEKSFAEKLCSPSNNGTCSGYKYTELLPNQYLETEYNVNYNTKNISVSKSEKFNCNDYKECKDDTCKRRIEFCNPYVD